MPTFFEPSPVRTLTGTEAILPGVKVRDLGGWAMGDLRLNTNRGALAQFLVAKAVGDDRLMDGWSNFDVHSSEGIKVEIKSSAYLQSWKQARLSSIVFSGLTGIPWSEDSGYGPDRIVRADVFVFAVNTCQDPTTYDPLRLSDWVFYVAPGTVIAALQQHTLSLGRLKTLVTSPVTWEGIADTVRVAAAIDDSQH